MWGRDKAELAVVAPCAVAFFPAPKVSVIMQAAKKARGTGLAQEKLFSPCACSECSPAQSPDGHTVVSCVLCPVGHAVNINGIETTDL